MPANHRLAIVVPCYNEEEVLPETTRRLTELITALAGHGKISEASRIYFVDDGSRDATWDLIEQYARQNPFVKGIKLAHNRGHQNALMAGLLTAEGEVIISIDADLQDDTAAMEAMIDHFLAGKDIVFGVRSARTTDTLFKRWSAQGYYRFLSWMGVEAIFNHADYRLMSRRAVEALREFSETNIFLRGIIPALGFPSATVTYERSARFAGETKYPFRRMLALAIDGITSFSAVPLRIIAFLGLLVFVFSLMISLWALWVRLFSDQAVPGWASSVLPMYLLGGIQLLSLGIIGEYVAKIYLEAKRRPRFYVEKTV